MSTRICIYDPKPHFFEAAFQRDLRPNTDKKICGFKSVRISGDGTWWLSNKTKITIVNNTFSHRNLIIVKGTHCKDPTSRTDLSKLLSLPLLWSQQDKSPRSLLTVVVEVTGPFCNVRTFVGTQLRSTSHRIKTSDCYRVPSELTNLRPFDLIDDVDSSPLTKPHQQVQRSRSHQWYRVRTRFLLLRMFPNKTTLLPAQMRLPICRPAPIQTEPPLDSDSDSDTDPPPSRPTNELCR